jgi:nitrate/nitrite-specific signal transduction histidine kinase
VRVAIIVLTVVILALIWLTAKLGTVPLMEAEKRIEAGEPIPETGAKEFRNLARGYNKMRRKLYRDEEETP